MDKWKFDNARKLSVRELTKDIVSDRKGSEDVYSDAIARLERIEELMMERIDRAEHPVDARVEAHDMIRVCLMARLAMHAISKSIPVWDCIRKLGDGRFQVSFVVSEDEARAFTEAIETAHGALYAETTACAMNGDEEGVELRECDLPILDRLADRFSNCFSVGHGIAEGCRIIRDSVRAEAPPHDAASAECGSPPPASPAVAARPVSPSDQGGDGTGEVR